jgi:hypothetical protein
MPFPIQLRRATLVRRSLTANRERAASAPRAEIFLDSVRMPFELTGTFLNPGLKGSEQRVTARYFNKRVSNVPNA